MIRVYLFTLIAYHLLTCFATASISSIEREYPKSIPNNTDIGTNTKVTSLDRSKNTSYTPLTNLSSSAHESFIVLNNESDQNVKNTNFNTTKTETETIYEYYMRKSLDDGHTLTATSSFPLSKKLLQMKNDIDDSIIQSSLDELVTRVSDTGFFLQQNMIPLATSSEPLFGSGMYIIL